MDPYRGVVVCSISLPVRGPTNIAFGECPGANSGNLDCIYVTTARQGLSFPITANDGELFLIEDSGIEGVLPNKVEYEHIINYDYGWHPSV